MPLPRWITQALTVAQDWLYPPRCAVCDATAPPLCAACAAAIVPAPPMPSDLPYLSAARAAGAYVPPLSVAIQNFKYGRRLELAHPLGMLLYAALAPVMADWAPDVVVPVPLHWRRQLRRGFNQAEVLAREVARATKLPLDLRALRRIRHVPPQVGRTRAERLANLRGAFAVGPRASVGGQRVLLIDDVCTTGATLVAAAEPLAHAGAAAIYGLVVACA